MSIPQKTLTRLLWSLNVLLVLLFVFPMKELAAIFQFFGRLHPLVLHFPIALLVIALLFEVLAKRGQHEFTKGAQLLLWLGAYAAVISAIAGYLLSINGGYAGDSFVFHKWFGLATSLIVVLLIDLRERLSNAVLPLYSVLVVLLIITGHYGASLTHGEDFLTEVFDSAEALTLDAEAPVFTQVVQPVLDAKCTSCHNPNKLKGSLLLDTQEGILKGGESGSILAPGDLIKSKLISHLLLPMEDKLHMPPKGKNQLTNEEIKLLSWWVESGASFSSLVRDIDQSDAIQPVLTSYFAPEEEIDIDFADPDLLSALNSGGLSVKQIEPDKPYLEVYMGQKNTLDADQLKQLRKIDEQIFTLDLGGSRVDKSILKEVARYENLHRLYLDNTDANDDMISALRKLKQLRYLNLYGTKITRKGASLMAKLPELNQLYLWQTDLSHEELTVLQTDHPSIQIDGGLPEDSEFTKAELSPPKLEYASTFFDEELSVEVSYNLSNTNLFYQLGGGAIQPLENGQVKLTESGKLTVFAKKEGWEDSPVTEQVFIKVVDSGVQQTILKHDPKGSYKAKGVSTLFDLRKGSENFRDGEWLGFNGDDLIVDVELKQSREISSVFISTMDDIGSWIFPPTALEVWGGSEAGKLTKLQELEFTRPEGPEPKHMIIHELNFDAQKLKHIQVRAKNYGTLPEWHPGKDTPAWLFIDEIAFN
ncbi:MAG: chitobiase/beta-hexosaminidase C-terminal domain-containing protein [Roseivirga sp.]